MNKLRIKSENFVKILVLLCTISTFPPGYTKNNVPRGPVVHGEYFISKWSGELKGTIHTKKDHKTKIINFTIEFVGIQEGSMNKIVVSPFNISGYAGFLIPVDKNVILPLPQQKYNLDNVRLGFVFKDRDKINLSLDEDYVVVTELLKSQLIPAKIDILSNSVKINYSVQDGIPPNFYLNIKGELYKVTVQKKVFNKNLFPGEKIVTDKSSRVELLLDNETNLFLAENTQINVLSEKQIEIFTGKLYVVIEKPKKTLQQQKFIFTVHPLQGKIEHGKCLIEKINDTTNLTILEGKIEIFDLKNNKTFNVEKNKRFTYRKDSYSLSPINPEKIYPWWK